MKVSIEQAYAAACQKIGEGVVRESMLLDVLSEKDVEISALKEKLVSAGLIKEATEIVEGLPERDS